ncbi:MAG: hypothetical protein R3F20_10745 [Planctomycetota bacterium]
MLLRERDRRGSVPTRSRALGPGIVALGLFVAGALNLGARLDRGLALLGFGLVRARGRTRVPTPSPLCCCERRAFATARRALLGER